jgi:hypothetical protein
VTSQEQQPDLKAMNPRFVNPAADHRARPFERALGPAIAPWRASVGHQTRRVHLSRHCHNATRFNAAELQRALNYKEYQ